MLWLTRWWLKRLGDSKNARALPRLLRSLESSVAEVRIAAGSALNILAIFVPFPEAAKRALVVALRDTDPRVRREAAHALGTCALKPPPWPDAVVPLVGALADEDLSVRVSAAYSLAWNRGEEGVTALIAALSDRETAVRRAAASALRQIAPVDALKAVTAALGDVDQQVRSYATQALAAIRAKEAQPKDGASRVVVAGNTVHCSSCGGLLEYMGGLFAANIAAGARVSVLGGSTAGLSQYDQWHGNACPTCRTVYCSNCIKTGGPTPCPRCGTPTKVAFRSTLEAFASAGASSRT